MESRWIKEFFKEEQLQDADGFNDSSFFVPPVPAYAAFSTGAKFGQHGIRERTIEENGLVVCEITGQPEIDPRTGEKLRLVCAHLNHDRKYPFYNDPYNGMYMTQMAHLAHHLYHQEVGTPDAIGMNYDWNRDAIYKNIEEILQLNHLPYTDAEVRKLCKSARMYYWLIEEKIPAFKAAHPLKETKLHRSAAAYREA